MKVLNCSFNQLTEISNIAKLNNLEKLDIYYNDLGLDDCKDINDLNKWLIEIKLNPQLNGELDIFNHKWLKKNTALDKYENKSYVDLVNMVSYNPMMAAQHDKALSILKQAIKIKPEAYEAWAEKASIHNFYNEFDESITACEKAISIDSKKYEAILTKGIVLIKKGRFNDALEQINKVINNEYLRNAVKETGNFSNIQDKNQLVYAMSQKGMDTSKTFST